MAIKKTHFIGISLFLFIGFACMCNAQTAIEKSYLEDLYIDLHKHPELSFLEKKTSARMATELNAIGFEVTTQYGGHGVVGVLKNGAGPTILVRADMDGLPVKEETGKTYASQIRQVDITGEEVPVMHACGHDIHMTVWLGTARYLAENKQSWSGTLIFIGQPAEERSGGAKAMLKAGLYEDFGVPDYALALHVSASMPAGKVGLCKEYAMANVDMLKIKVKGVGGHGAYPHTTKDPVNLASRIINELQTIVSREISPLEPAVVTVGSIHGGTKGNVIPDAVELELTMRSYSDEVRNHIIEAIERKCVGLAIASGLSEDMYPELTLRDEYTPSLYNNPALTERLYTAFQKAIGEEHVLITPPVMAGEDFGRFGRTEHQVPIMLYWLGSVEQQTYHKAMEEGTTLPSLHNSKFAPDYKVTIPVGVKTMSAAVMELLKG